MNQELKVEIKDDKSPRFETIIQSYTEPIASKVIPFIGFSCLEQAGIPSQAILSIANPDTKISQGIFNKTFRISIGYSGYLKDKFYRNMQPVFTGKSLQPPIFQNSGSTDQVLNIPLTYVPATPSYGAYTTNDTLGNVMPKILPENVVIKYVPTTLKNQYLKKKLSIQSSPSFAVIERYFEKNENVIIKYIGSDGSFLITSKDTNNQSFNANIASKNNTGIIFNSNRETSLKTKYAVIDASGSLNIELAFVLPNLLYKTHAYIENLSLIHI